MQNIDFKKPQVIFIASDEREIIFDELFNQLQSYIPYVYYLSLKIKEYNKWNKYCFLLDEIINEDFKYKNIDKIHYKNDCYNELHNYNFIKKIYVFDIDFIPEYLNNNVFNIIIYEKINIPNSIYNNINYIIYNINFLDYRPYKKLKISNNKFEEKYRIINLNNNN